jgi:hypothetical protein
LLRRNCTDRAMCELRDVLRFATPEGVAACERIAGRDAAAAARVRDVS